MGFITQFNNIMWGVVLSVILLGTGLLYSLKLKFPQISCTKYIGKSLKNTLKSEDGSVSGFGALCAAVGGQVGTGSLVGVASALLAGGPGAMFWMWITALFGMVLSFAEATLGQLFHEKGEDGNFYGGAPYYMSKGIDNKVLAVLYAAVNIFAIGICIAMLQNNSIAAAVTGVFNIPNWTIGLAVTVLAGFIVLGGVKRITEAASLIVPFMAAAYMVCVIFIIVSHITEVPAMLSNIFTSAFTLKATAGGIAGYTIKEALRNGVARGLFSNDAGNGCAASMHASAKVKHPANQGFSAMFGTFLTTIIICSCTGFAILLSGVLNSGNTGINLLQDAFNSNIGIIGSYFVMIMSFLFCFTTLITDIFYGEVGVRYLLKNKPDIVERSVTIFKIVVLGCVAFGSVLSLDTLWNLVDFSVAFLVLFNVFSLLKMMKYVKYVLVDYFKQLKNGNAEPVWDENINIKDICN